MAEREQVRRTKRAKEKPPVEQVEAKPQKSAEELKAEVDELLDEIDGLLEENAQEFVAQYVQKGGQ